MYRVLNWHNIWMAVLLLCALQVQASGKVILEGRVPDQQSKTMLLAKASQIYGAARIEDRIVVGNVRAPAGWTNRVTLSIGPELSNISKGSVAFRSSWVDLAGLVSSNEQRDAIARTVQFNMGQGVGVRNALTVDNAVQGAIDALLMKQTIEFEVGSSVLTPKGIQLLDQLIPLIKEAGNKPVIVEGHTDNTGNPAKNLALSQARADAVKNYLTNAGIAQGQISASGFGDQVPVADNGSNEGRAKNRRIAIKIANL